MARIYNDAGWVNWDYIMLQKESIISIVGARGTGKTYGCFKWLVEHRKKFIYLRRLKSQLEECRKDAGNPFKKLNNDLGINIKPFPLAGSVAFNYEEKNGDTAAVGVALSVVANIRGVDYSDFDYIVFDEFVSSDGERPIKNEFQAFLNFYETVNRNRELEGKEPVKALMLGNANKISNPYFVGWHCMRRVLNMIKGGQMVWRSDDRTRMIILLLESPISERKQDTVLYQNANQDFITMALDNAFRTDATNIKSEPLKEFNHIVSVGEIGIYKHKSQRRYYVSSTVSVPFYEAFGMGLKMFQLDYYMIRVYYMVNKTVSFENFETELIFREMFNL